jgi:enterochelin esterase-like enzyme
MPARRLLALLVVIPFALHAQGDTAIRVHSPAVTGDLRLHPFASKIYGNRRMLRVLLPAGYAAPANKAKRYPILYLADGQNLFDPSTSVFAPREWHVDEIVKQLVADGKIPPMIIVGVDDAGPVARAHEYLPYPDKGAESSPSFDAHPEGKRYPDFMIQEVMPFINARYRTLRDADHTGIGGSSYGGLISSYVVAARPGVFGRLLSESTTYRVFDYADARAVTQWPARIFLGVGTNEESKPDCVPGPAPTLADSTRSNLDTW